MSYGPQMYMVHCVCRCNARHMGGPYNSRRKAMEALRAWWKAHRHTEGLCHVDTSEIKGGDADQYSVTQINPYITMETCKPIKDITS